MAIIDFFDRGWGTNPRGVAYVQGERACSFQEAGELSCRLANGLIAAGFGKGAKAAVWAGNDVTAWICTLGIWRAGLTWIPVSGHSPPENSQFILDQFDCEVLFFTKAYKEVIDALRPRLPKIRLLVCIDADTEWAPSLTTWSADHPSTVPRVDYDMEDVVAISATGGTTGLPKGVMNTHRSMQTYFAQYMIACAYPSERPVNLAAAPMTHTAGLLSIPCTARGGTVVVIEKPDPKLLLDAIARHRITEFFLPPTVIYRLLDVPGIEERDFSSLRYLLYGAAPMSVDKLKRAIEVFGPVMMEGYGQTEAPASIAFLTPSEHFVDGKLAPDERLSSVGRPCPLVRVEILNEEGEVLSRGETGEICVQGDLVMKGYYKAPEQTAKTIVDGWLHTGDIGHFDAEGYLHITDRKKDMIISGGFNVYPSEVEQVIWSHPAVQDCAVIGVPHEEWGEAVKAVVELNVGHSTTPEEIIALCKDRLGSVKAPKSVDFVATLPRSPVGKVLKKDLRERYWQGEQRKI
ncbi:MAG: AMP-binding protein [Burkholderiaceae bacterium]|nr:AMP-binding protein [Burkholderiaceae bacterium]MEB2317854.1 AMP-binding protein [Pseudomonadota bacterium]